MRIKVMEENQYLISRFDIFRLTHACICIYATGISCASRSDSSFITFLLKMTRAQREISRQLGMISGELRVRRGPPAADLKTFTSPLTRIY